MSKSAGTGEPVTFRCGRERREWGYVPPDAHRVIRTGRERPYKRQGTGLRTSNTAREYRCSCGHIGWSALYDLTRCPLAQA